MSLDDIKMLPSDLQDEQYLESGGFGKVSLCRHRAHGLVILKRVYTGPERTEYNESLLEEGKMMRRLQHSRVVRLLGVILEEGDYSLVMEYMEKGSLMHVLRVQISIPLSLKGRIILETIEGMCYLHREGVIHKDLKPQNILVDNDFHIKIADLGVASFKTWSKLTREESNKRRLTGTLGPQKNGGTLSYMAPEHLSDINVRPSEKSDVYSFAIVLWTIFANKEPYENAMCEDQLIACVKSGNRPDLEYIIEFCPQQIISLMKKCWESDPALRPPFTDIEEMFRPFYSSQLEKRVEEAVASLKEKFPRENEIVRRMQSLQMDCVPLPPSRSNSATEQPHSLHSSQGLGAPVEESLFTPCPDHQPEENEFNLQSKLQEEANYHLFGSRMDRPAKMQPTPASQEERRRRVIHDPFAPQKAPESGQNPGAKGFVYSSPAGTGVAGHAPAMLTSHPTPGHVQAGLTSHPTPGHVQAGLNNHPTPGHMPAALTSHPTPGHVPATLTSHPLPGHVPAGLTNNSSMLYWPDPYAMQSFGARGLDLMGLQLWNGPSTLWPPLKVPVPENHVVVNTPTMPFVSQLSREEASRCHIVNSSAIQIGDNNYMEVKTSASPQWDCGSLSPRADPAHESQYQEIFGNSTSVTDKHLDPIRDNLGRHWKSLARKLGFSETQIEEIDHDYERDGLKEKVYQMLQKWVMREGSKGATVGKLAWALFQCSQMRLLNHLVLASQD